MVEIHEPVRILFVIETTPERLMATLEKNPAHMRLLVNRWIRLAAQDPTTGEIQVYRDGAFEPMELLEEPVPVAATSHAWYGGRTEHLPFATVTAGL
jgi:hypothetical protein